MATATAINVQRTYNTGNYTTLRLGGDFSLDNGETLVEGMKDATSQIDTAYKEIVGQPQTTPAAAPKPTTQQTTISKNEKIHLVFGSKSLQALVNRIAEGGGGLKEKVTWDMIDSRYTYDEESRIAIESAMKLN